MQGGDQSIRPNLLLVMTDQQRADSLGTYGNPFAQTPSLDCLARKGVRFDLSFVGGFPCSPSRACLLTGLYPRSHGVRTNEMVLPGSIPSLGSVLRDEGYHTAWIGKWHLGGSIYTADWAYEAVERKGTEHLRKFPVRLGEELPQSGFTHWVGGVGHYLRYLREVGLDHLLIRDRRYGGHVPGPVVDDHSVMPEEHFVTAFLAREAISYIEQVQDPFCLVLSLYGPHLPIAPPEPWDKLYPPEEVMLPPNFNDRLECKPAITQHGNPWHKLGEWSEEEWRGMISRYHGYVSYIDGWVGKVLSALQRSGRENDTMVLFTSDHGDMLGSHGFAYKGYYCYDEVIRVPLILRDPRVNIGGAVCDGMVSNVDILPTLLELMGVRVPEGVEGEAISFTEGMPEVRRDAVFMEIDVPGDVGIQMVRTRRWKYCRNWRPRQVDELYDLNNDPLEMSNLVSSREHAGVLRELRERLGGWTGGRPPTAE